MYAGSWLSAGGAGDGAGTGTGAGAGAGAGAGVGCIVGRSAGGGGAAAQQSNGYPITRVVEHWPHDPQLPVLAHQ